MSKLTEIYYWFLGAALLVAALAKAIWLPAEARSGLLQHTWFLALVVLIESTAAGWFFLDARHWGRATRTLGIGLFGILAGVSFWAVLRNEPCQCFGTEAIPPAATLAFDLLAVTALAVLPPPTADSANTPRRMRVGLASGLVCGIGLAAWAYHQTPAELTPGALADGAHTVLLKPSSWTGQELPLLGHLQLKANLREGEWMVVLYRPDCPHCLQLLPALRARYARSEAAERLALIDISSGQAPGAVEPEEMADSVFGRLSPQRKWILVNGPPVGLRMVEGRVRGVLNADQLHSLANGMEPAVP
jgi:hypothetical protein